jgi:hypothetical protein
MPSIEMTQDYAHSLFEYKDGNLYWKVKKAPHVHVGAEVGSPAHGYKTVYVDGRNWRIHRLVFLMQHGYLPKMVDHINGNRADNRIENLRAADDFQNAHNMNMRPDNKSGIKGVSWNSDRCKWVARVNFKRKTYQVGYFEDIELAEFAVQMAREKYHGAYANHGKTLARPTEEELA